MFWTDVSDITVSMVQLCETLVYTSALISSDINYMMWSIQTIEKHQRMLRSCHTAFATCPELSSWQTASGWCPKFDSTGKGVNNVANQASYSMSRAQSSAWWPEHLELKSWPHCGFLSNTKFLPHWSSSIQIHLSPGSSPKTRCLHTLPSWNLPCLLTSCLWLAKSAPAVAQSQRRPC